MEITEVKVVQIGVDIEIRITVNNGLRFYSRCGFETISDARRAMKKYGLVETEADSGPTSRKEAMSDD